MARLWFSRCNYELGIPLGAMYTFYRVRQLRTKSGWRALPRVSAFHGAELSQAARSLPPGILLTCGAVRFIVAFGSRPNQHEPDT